MTPAEQLRAAFASKRHKYHAKPVEVDGIKFPSTAEANRWLALRTLEVNGCIQNLTRQKRYDLVVKGPHGTFKRTYVSDFEYDEDGVHVTEDCKGFQTDVYKIKRDLMLALYGIRIRETGKGRSR